MPPMRAKHLSSAPGRSFARGPVASVLRVASGSTLAAILASACLPGDDRPPPGSLTVTSEPSDALRDGFLTRDGWTIHFDELKTAVGDIRLRNDDHTFGGDSDSCNDYSATRYEWLFDFAQVDGPQKTGLVYGLGRCSIEFAVKSPSNDTVLGIGATDEDVEIMTIEENDTYAMEAEVAMIVRGTARRGDVTKSFDWTFRSEYEVDECESAEDDDVLLSVVDLRDGIDAELRVVIRGEELFRTYAAYDAPIRFSHYADADADGDGEVTLEELEEVEPPEVPQEALDAADEGGDVEDEEDGELDYDPLRDPETLGELLYRALLPRVGAIAGSADCDTKID